MGVPAAIVRAVEIVLLDVTLNSYSQFLLDFLGKELLSFLLISFKVRLMSATAFGFY